MDLYHLLGVGLAELLHAPVSAEAASAQTKVFNSDSQNLNVRPVRQLSDQACCVGKTAFEVFQVLALQGLPAKSVQRRIEYYINKSLDSSYARQMAARKFNKLAETWTVKSASGRVELTARAFGVDEWLEERTKISVRLVVRTRVLIAS